MKLDIDIMTLAYLYLEKKRKPFTIVDIIFVCEEICKKVDMINQKKKLISFTKQGCIVNDNWYKIKNKF